MKSFAGSFIIVAAISLVLPRADMAIWPALLARPFQDAANGSSFSCPMHPDVKSGRAGVCPRCGMALVPMDSELVGQYLLDFDLTPGPLRAGERGRVRFFISDPRTHAIVRDFDLIHEKRLHLFIVSDDLEYFSHVHPVLHPDGSWDLDVVLPRQGVYQLCADFMPAGGTPQLIQKSVITAGYAGDLAEAASHLVPDLTPKTLGGVRVRIETPRAIAGIEQSLTFVLEDAGNGEPIRDLEPFLGAWGHLFIASWDLADVTHSHPLPEVSVPGGPTITFQTRFARSGLYRVWAQFERRGETITAPFTIPVGERR